MASDTRHTAEPDDDIRDRLLRAAADEFSERGYEGARVQDIARRAGLSTGAIYNRFRGKDELLVAALAQTVDLDQRIDRADAGSPTDILEMLGSSLLEEDTLGVASKMFIEAVATSQREPQVGDMLHRLMEDERARVGKLIDQAKTDGLFDDSLDTDAVVKFCQALGLGFCMFRGLGVDLPEPDAWQRVIATIISAAAPGDTANTTTD